MKRVLGGTLLVAGTSIGAGMLALPVVTASGGFLPALFVYFLCWIFMTGTGLLMLELCLKLPPDANLVTMGATYLGKWGKMAAWGLYLFLFYCLTIAYICGGGGLLADWLGLKLWVSQLIFTALLAPVVLRGAKKVDQVNKFLMLGLIISYFGFVFLGLSQIDLSRLQRIEWMSAWGALPVIFTSFSYQGVIPSLTAYLQRDVKSLRISIVAGTSLAFLIYVIWEILVLGIAPFEDLETAKALGQTAAHALPSISVVGRGFAFFAIATSFLGVTLGLLDFLADGLKLTQRGFRKLFLGSITFLPPLIIALIYPHVFITALIFAGGIGCALLLGLMPILMTWVARYRGEGHGGPILLGGGKGLLVLMILFIFFELGLELFI